MEFNELELNMIVYHTHLNKKFIVSELEDDDFVTLTVDGLDWTLSKRGYNRIKDEFVLVKAE